MHVLHRLEADVRLQDWSALARRPLVHQRGLQVKDEQEYGTRASHF